jgi:carbon-monoxide dehydrogenase medium subunit
VAGIDNNPNIRESLKQGEVMLRKLNEFEYFEPSELSEALSLIERYGGEAKIIAGGTDLLVWMKEGVLSPKYMINIKQITGIDQIDYDESEGFNIGALTTIRAIETSKIIKQNIFALYQAASQLGSIQVRSLATIGGNICTASPSAETAPALLVLGAKVKLVGSKGERSLPLEEFFKGPGEADIDKEILTGIHIPPLGPNCRSVYKAKNRGSAVDCASVGVAAAGNIDSSSKKLKGVRIALGAVAAVPMRAYAAEKVMEGKAIDAELIEKAAQAASDVARPIDDHRASAWYRKEMVKVLLRRSLEEIFPI